MNISKYQVIFAFAFFVSSILSANIDQAVPQRFNTFNEDFWFKLAQYLSIPQKELGFLNKAASRAVFTYFPLQKVMSERFPSIEGLENVKRADDLIALKNLFYSKDEFHRFQAIGAALVVNQAFPHNGDLISRYVLCEYFSLPLESLQSLNYEIRDVNIIFYKALERKSFDLVMKIFIKFPSKFSAFFEYSSFNSDLTTAFFKHAFCDDLSNLSIYDTFYNSLNIEISQSLFIFHSILAGVPEHFYWHRFDSFDVCSGTLIKLLTETFMDIDEAKKAEIYSLTARLVDQLENILHFNNTNIDNEQEELISIQEIVDGYRLLNRIRFGSDNFYFKPEFKSGKVVEEFYDMAIFVAILANRLELAHAMIKEAPFSFAKRKYPDFRVIVNCFDLLSETEKQDAFNNGDLLSNLIKVYDAHATQNISARKLAIDFRVKESKKSRSLPDSFNFVFDIENSISSIEDTCRLEDLPKILLRGNKNTDEEGLYSIFAGLIRSIPHILPHVDPIPVEIELVKTILKYEPLRNIVLESRLKFIVSIEHFAQLLFESLVPLKEILVLPNLDILLQILFSNTQFRNLEAFLNLNIAEIFSSNPRIFSYRNFHPTKLFFRLRFALHYWLEGPHRERIFEVPIAFRELLAKESCEQDKNYLLQKN